MPSTLDIASTTFAKQQRRNSTGSNIPKPCVSFAANEIPVSPRVRNSKRTQRFSTLPLSTYPLEPVFLAHEQLDRTQIIDPVRSSNADLKKQRCNIIYHPYAVDPVVTHTGIRHRTSGSRIDQVHLLSGENCGVSKEMRKTTNFRDTPLQPISRMIPSVSAPSLEILACPFPNADIVAGDTATVLTMEEDSTSHFLGKSPNDHFQELVEAAGLTYQTHASLSLKDFFLEVTPEHIIGYQSDVINAVRKNDINALHQIVGSGRSLQACNKFGESILHMACRRGSTHVVRFLLDEGVSVRLRDDYGRTPLHDALWTQEPEFDLVELLVRVCPDLLLITDKRGFTPLSYVRRDHWIPWCQFLDDHKDIVLPTELRVSRMC